MLRVLLSVVVAGAASAADPAARFVVPGADGLLAYTVDERGNRVPDFSHCGYGGGGVAIPDVAARVAVKAESGDATGRIQAALDHVAALPPDARGLRGAVLLLSGRHEVAGQLRITESGVVLRGQGPGTVLVATGTDRRTIVTIRGEADRASGKGSPVVDRYVPVGATQLRVKEPAAFRAGDTVAIEHPSTREWIAALGMDRFPSRDKGSYLDWKPGTLDLRIDRVVTAIDGDRVLLDAPLTVALDSAISRARVVSYSWPGRVERAGVEHLRCESTFDAANPHDEDHAWGGVGFENARDGWVRQVTFSHLAGSAVAVWQSASRITVEDCVSERPVSEVGGQRRHTFYTAGQQTLFQRCTADQGRHDFAVGYLAAGPNAFVRCKATNAHQFSGPIESWATGVLYDNVTIDGGGLSLTNRETDGQGVGWAAANSVLWQCVAPVVTCRNPPTARNWAIGVWGQFVGDGHWRSLNEFVKPQSLFEAQLAERLGEKATENLRRRTIESAEVGGRSAERKPDEKTRNAGLRLKDGRLVAGDELVAGGRTGTAWWRGSILPSRATEVGVGVTRFVPGRDGSGFTDDLGQLTDEMQAKGLAVLEHHWGLWYDRRRDDHQMVRRIDGEVWAPFYEQPWARSGRGRAWDGLSQYDLSKFNPWYFARLKRFADLCDRKGLVLVQQMYFQHNVLEAGAHWADFPWRPANCLQATGFPEPPEYAGGKRVFMAEAFYDVTHPVRRELHRAYIRHCLDTLGGNSNVIFQTGEEFTGPLPFVRFWLDTVEEWQQEKGRKVLVGLSCTRDVQDAILADPARAAVVSVIDLRYWWYTADGVAYDPKGGENLAPRQQLRGWTGSKSRSDAAAARMVREYRTRFPDKAVLASLDGASGWAVAAAGGSLPNLPRTTEAKLRASLPRMRPVASAAGQWALADLGREYLVYAAEAGTIRLDLTGEFVARWVDLKTGEAKPGDSVSGVDGWRVSGPAVLWLTRK